MTSAFKWSAAARAALMSPTTVTLSIGSRSGPEAHAPTTLKPASGWRRREAIRCVTFRRSPTARTRESATITRAIVVKHPASEFAVNEQGHQADGKDHCCCQSLWTPSDDEDDYTQEGDESERPSGNPLVLMGTRPEKACVVGAGKCECADPEDRHGRSEG